MKLAGGIFKKRRRGLGGADEEQPTIWRRERKKWKSWDRNYGFGEAFEGWNGSERRPVRGVGDGSHYKKGEKETCGVYSSLYIYLIPRGFFLIRVSNGPLNVKHVAEL